MNYYILIPIVFTIFCLFMRFRPLKPTQKIARNNAAFMGLDMLIDGGRWFSRVIWWIPVLLAWLVYFILN